MLYTTPIKTPAGYQDYLNDKDSNTVPGLDEGKNSPSFGGSLLLERKGKEAEATYDSWLFPTDDRTPDVKTKAWDFTFSAPKSVSLEGLAMGNKDMLDAHREAVGLAMNMAEQMLGTPIAWESYEHHISRGGKGAKGMATVPDPQLHTHVMVPNNTEGKDGVAALDRNTVISEDFTKMVGMVYRHQLADRLSARGYELDIKGKGEYFELKGYSPETLRSFSKRSEQIKDFAKEKFGAEDTADLTQRQRNMASKSTRADKSDSFSREETPPGNTERATRDTEQNGHEQADSKERRNDNRANESGRGEHEYRNEKADEKAEAKQDGQSNREPNSGDAWAEGERLARESAFLARGEEDRPAISLGTIRDEWAKALNDLKHKGPIPEVDKFGYFADKSADTAYQSLKRIPEILDKRGTMTTYGLVREVLKNDMDANKGVTRIDPHMLTSLIDDMAKSRTLVASEDGKTLATPKRVALDSLDWELAGKAMSQSITNDKVANSYRESFALNKDRVAGAETGKGDGYARLRAFEWTDRSVFELKEHQENNGKKVVLLHDDNDVRNHLGEMRNKIEVLNALPNDVRFKHAKQELTPDDWKQFHKILADPSRKPDEAKRAAHVFVREKMGVAPAKTLGSHVGDVAKFAKGTYSMRGMTVYRKSFTGKQVKTSMALAVGIMAVKAALIIGGKVGALPLTALSEAAKAGLRARENATEQKATVYVLGPNVHRDSVSQVLRHAAGNPKAEIVMDQKANPFGARVHDYRREGVLDAVASRAVDGMVRDAEKPSDATLYVNSKGEASPAPRAYQPVRTNDAMLAEKINRAAETRLAESDAPTVKGFDKEGRERTFFVGATIENATDAKTGEKVKGVVIGAAETGELRLANGQRIREVSVAQGEKYSFTTTDSTEGKSLGKGDLDLMKGEKLRTATLDMRGDADDVRETASRMSTQKAASQTRNAFDRQKLNQTSATQSAENWRTTGRVERDSGGRAATLANLQGRVSALTDKVGARLKQAADNTDKQRAQAEKRSRNPVKARERGASR